MSASGSIPNASVMRPGTVTLAENVKLTNALRFVLGQGRRNLTPG